MPVPATEPVIRAALAEMRGQCCINDAQRALWDWLADVSLAWMVDSAEDERQDAEMSLRRWLADDMAYRLTYQLPDLASDLKGTPGHAAAVAALDEADDIVGRLLLIMTEDDHRH
jgi:hypothetical protein